MHRLQQLGLRDAGLMEVRHPHLVKRYNDALALLAGRQTALASFRIDATGFSPEVAGELGDPDYMNPHGVNRRYILIHMGQRDLPVLDQRFTSTRWLMRAFVEQNREALFALTSKDAVYGELEDNTYKVNGLDDLLSIKRVVFTVHTPSGLAEKAERLTRMVAEFAASDSMWLDEAAVAEMCDLAKAAGDVRRNPSVPSALAFDKGNFHSSHLGGLYVFHGAERVTVVHEDPDFACPLKWQGKRIQPIEATDTTGVIDFLIDAGLVEMPTRDFVKSRRESLLRKMEFMVVDHVSALEPGADLSRLDAEGVKKAIYRHHDHLPTEFHEIARAVKFCDHGLDWDAADADPSTLAYMTSAKRGDDRDIVNHLLAHLTPADYLGTFVCNNALFLRRYEGWNEARRGYVTAMLTKTLGGRCASTLTADMPAVGRAAL